MKRESDNTMPYRLVMFVGLACLLFVGGCKFILMNVKSNDIKQGDNIEIEVNARDTNDLTKLEYKVNNQQTVHNAPPTITFPKTVIYDSAKTTGTYHDKITLWGKATYQDGSTRTFGPEDRGLTVCKNSREDGDRTFAIYIAHDDEDREDLRSEMANAFQDEISSLDESQYFWAEPRFYTNQAIHFANSVDMAISLGHGRHHAYKAGENAGDWVDSDEMAFGGFEPAHQTGDLEYLVFGSCQTLSMDEVVDIYLSGGNGWGIVIM